jgi:hypothetical protein
MKKLTKEQELKQEQKRIALIEKNAPLLFDIKNATEEGIKFKNQLDALNKKNADIVKTQKEKCLSDFNKLQTFLGEYKDLVALYGDGSESDGNFGFSIGGGHPNTIQVAYYFTRDWWEDADNFETINGKNYPIYYPEQLEVWSDNVGETETYESLEELFNDNNYVRVIEQLLTEYIIKG